MQPLMVIRLATMVMRLIMGLVSTIGRTVITFTDLFLITGEVMVGGEVTIGAAITEAGMAEEGIGVVTAVGMAGNGYAPIGTF